MGKFQGANIVESRDYDNPSNPKESTYHVRLPKTVPEAVIDITTGKTLRTILTEQASEISAAKTAANEAKSTAAAASSSMSGIDNKLAGKANSEHTHTAAQISGLPTSLPANGGNADTVDGAHVVTTSELGLHRMASGTAAANSTNCPPGCWYGQYE